MADQEFTTKEIQSEEWRPIDGYEGKYCVSNLGRVSRVTAARISPLVPTKGTKGRYYKVNLSGGNRTSLKSFRVHRLVANAFIGPLPDGHTTNHKDGDRLNNRLGNLEYVTQSENVRHAMSLGLIRPPIRWVGPSPSLIKQRLLAACVDPAIIETAFRRY